METKKIQENKIDIKYYFKRLIAFIVDFFICILIFTFYMKLTYMQLTVNSFKSEGRYPLSEITVFVMIYYIIQEYYFNRTIGKRLFGLKVVKLDGTNLKFMDLLKRHLFDFIEITILPPIIFIIIELTTFRKQRLGDILAKTTVISTI